MHYDVIVSMAAGLRLQKACCRPAAGLQSSAKAEWFIAS
jgi:hypothetical protein